MLMSHPWPALTAACHSASPPSLARNTDLDPCLRRLQDCLKCDSVVAVDLMAPAVAAVIGCSNGSDFDVDSLKKLLRARESYNALDRCAPLQAGAATAAAAQIVLAGHAERTTSILSFQVPAGPHTTITIIAMRHVSRPPFGANDERVLLRYADWVADHIAIWLRLRDGEQHRIGLQGALDQVGFAMIMLDRDGRTIGTNRAAQGLLAAGDGLIAVGEMLSAPMLEDAVRLHSAIGHALVGPLHGARAPVLTVRRKRRRPLVIAVLRVAAQPQAGETAIVLQVIEPDRDRDSAITANCTLYGFTGAEARLAKLLVSGASLAEAAAALRIQMPTARTYLKQAFAKSGTNRQAALVHVLLSSLVHPANDTVLTAM